MSLRRLAIGLLLLALAGCKANTTQVRQSFSFEKQNQNEAVILIGIRGNPPSSGAYTRMALVFQSYDPQTDTLSAGRVFNIVADRCRPRPCNDFQTARYHVLHVPAGDYALKAIATINDLSLIKTVKATSLVGMGASKGLFGATVLPTRGAVAGGMRYHFGPGEVVFLGEFVIDAVSFPATIGEIIRDDTKIERLRRAVPGIANAAFVFRQPNDATGQPIQVRNFTGVISTDPTDQSLQVQAPEGNNPTEGGVVIQEEQ